MEYSSILSEKSALSFNEVVDGHAMHFSCCHFWLAEGWASQAPMVSRNAFPSAEKICAGLRPTDKINPQISGLPGRHGSDGSDVPSARSDLELSKHDLMPNWSGNIKAQFGAKLGN